MCSTSGGWIFPCDPQFGLKAGRILDLYERRWQGIPLGPREYVLCDNVFASVLGPSHPNHLFMIAGQCGDTINNPAARDTMAAK